MDEFDTNKIEALGSIWKIYFVGVEAPSEEDVATALAPLGGVKAKIVTETVRALVTPNIKQEEAAHE